MKDSEQLSRWKGIMAMADTLYEAVQDIHADGCSIIISMTGPQATMQISEDGNEAFDGFLATGGRPDRLVASLRNIMEMDSLEGVKNALAFEKMVDLKEGISQKHSVNIEDFKPMDTDVLKKANSIIKQFKNGNNE